MQFLLGNGAMQTTAAFVKQPTGAVIKTMLQVKPLAPMRIVEWGFSYDGVAAATPGQVELIETGTIFATVTANVAADTTQYDAEAILFNNNAFFLSYGTAATGYNASVEGSIVAVRNLAGCQLTAPTNEIIEQFPLGYRPLVQANNALRMRMTFGTTVNAYCYVIVEF